MSRPFAPKTNWAVLLSVVTSGPELIRTGGARPSTLHSHSAGVRSTLPSASTARTRNECSPKTRSLYVTGDEHAVKTPASAASSRAHSKVAFCTLDTNLNVAVLLSVGSAGVLMIAVSGRALIVHA